MIQFKNEHLTVFESQLFKTTTAVVQTDDCIIVVDPTWLPKEVETIRQYVHAFQHNRPIYLLFTHSDWDHILGYGAFPEALVIASEGLIERNNKEDILEQIREFDDKYYLDRDYPIMYPKVDIVVREDGQIFNIGNTSLTFYKAQGHTNDSIFTIIESLGIWISGDYLSDIEFPFISFSSEKYDETLEKTEMILKKHDIRFLVPGHGHLTESRDEIIKRKKASLNYIKELRRSIQSNNRGYHLLEGYNYIRGLKEFHEENISLVKKELGK